MRRFKPWFGFQKSFEIFESFQILVVQNFINHFPIPFSNLAHHPDGSTLPSALARLTAAQQATLALAAGAQPMCISSSCELYSVLATGVRPVSWWP
jgi:hypothetical protein